MQHLTTHDAPGAAPCPLCFSPITAKDLRSVAVREAPVPGLGDTATLTLVRCVKGSGRPGPARSGVPPVGTAPSAAPVPEDAFSKLAVTDNPLPLWLADARELGEEAAELAGEAGPGAAEAQLSASFLHIAAESLAGRARAWVERRCMLQSRRGAVGAAQAHQEQHDTAAALGRAAKDRVLSCFDSHLSAASDRRARHDAFPSLAAGAAGEGAAAPAPPPASEPPGTPAAPARRGGRGREEPGAAAGRPGGAARGGGSPPDGEAPAPRLPPPPENEWVFFQDRHGQLAFLHPLCMRVLAHHCGSYDALPEALTARVVEVDEQVLDAEGRRRLRFLSHLPLTSTVRLLEVDLGPVLPAGALEPFREELEARARRRQRALRREREEDRRARRAEAEARRARQGPSGEELRAMPALARPVPGDEAGAGGQGESPVAASPASPPAGQPGGPSFARMAKWGLAAGSSAADTAGGPSLQDLYGGGKGSAGSSAPGAGPALGTWGAGSPPAGWRGGGGAGAWGGGPGHADGAAGAAEVEGGVGMVSLGALMKEGGKKKAGGKGAGGGKKKGTTLWSIG